MIIISILNHKGGVGKTTSTANISAGLSLLNQKVLMIDLDPQANLTMHLGLSTRLDKTIYNALKGQCKLPIHKMKENLWLVPSTIDLAAIDLELMNEPGREYLLKELIVPTKNDFDYVLIDCPPSLGLLTLNALSASNKAIITVDPARFATEGMTRIFDIMNKVKSRINENLSEYKILITKYCSNKVLHQDIAHEIRSTYTNNVFSINIRTNVALEEAATIGKDIFSYNDKSSGAIEYKNICKELLEQ